MHHWCLFKALGQPRDLKFAMEGKLTSRKPTRPLQGGQSQVSVPQVPLHGHGDALETLSLVVRENLAMKKAMYHQIAREVP